jgi:hypothetical protein
LDEAETESLQTAWELPMPTDAGSTNGADSATTDSATTDTSAES